MSLNDWNDGWSEGRKAGIEACIAALEADDLHNPDPMWNGVNWNNAVFECRETLRALLDKP